MIADETTKPLVSCIMPTYNRRGFIPHAIQYFLRQDYNPKELVIIDDGTDTISDLVPHNKHIRYFRLNQKMTLGAKLNMACEYSFGTIIANWDDDDWYASWRLSYQVETLTSHGTDLCGINKLLYFDLRTGRAYQYIYPSDQRVWLLGSTLCYSKKLWINNRFADINVGMDGLFVWATPPERITVLQDSTFSVFMIHEYNVSPKKTEGEWWHPFPSEKIQSLMGPDWASYQSICAKTAVISGCRSAHIEDTASSSVKPIRNIFACLVHENQDCIVDLVRNLRFHDASSIILLYNGGEDPTLLNNHFPFEHYGAVVHPSPHLMKWGWLHRFALDCMQFSLDTFSFDTMTIVDSDQLGVRSGLSHYLGRYLSGKSDVGMLGNAPSPQTPTTNVPPAVQAFKEIDLWRPFLKRFSKGEEKFVHWTFWPSTVFMSDAVRDLVQLFAADEILQDIMCRSKIWATEEIILPTLVALLGYKIMKSPCSYDYVKYQVPFTSGHIDSALTREDVFWVHPVPRRYEDHLRSYIRVKFNHYGSFSGKELIIPAFEKNNDLDMLLTVPILKAMNKVEGWLEEDEADLLIAASRRALDSLPQPHSIVEIGSYCGRSTVVLGNVVRAICPESKIYAIDPHDGRVGSIDQGLRSLPPTLERFKHNIKNAGLADFVEIIQSHPVDVSWNKPISFLFIDSLHDYPNVVRDFWHFGKWVRPGGLVAFHDYADYYPGVVTFVNELLSIDEYQLLKKVKSLVVLKKFAHM
ncbi:MAG: class I SAM-dependent methyltransferase [bacterium]